jgi:hypothetical protein
MWEARVGGRLFLTCDAAENSRSRREALAARPGSLVQDGFGRVRPPVAGRRGHSMAEVRVPA